MDLIIIISLVFLISPLLGYLLISSNLAMMTKVILGSILVVVLTISPILVMLLAGGSGG